MPRHLHHRFLPGHRHELEKRRLALEERKAAPEAAVATVYSVVYITATPTFSGPVGGYLTLGPTPTTSSAAGYFAYPVQAAPSSAVATNAFGYPVQAASSASNAFLVGTPLQSIHPSSSSASSLNFLFPGVVAASSSKASLLASPSSILASTSATTSTSSIMPSTTPSSTGSQSDASVSAASTAGTLSGSIARPTEAAVTRPTTSKAVSTGAQVGIAVGAIVGAAIICLLLYLLYRKRKSRRNQREQSEDEKALRPSPQSYEPHVTVRKSPQQPPRLSLRPVTEMFPNSQITEKHAFEAAMANAAVPERKPVMGAPSATNPFVDRTITPAVASQAAVISANSVDQSASNASVPTLSNAAVRKPLSDKSNRSSDSSDGRDASATIQAFPMPLSLPRTRPQNGPKTFGGFDVHRVQMDFKPTMDDELELHAGQLVRLLHEYDDGWVSSNLSASLIRHSFFQALCTRLDRSRQGVAPRTCISRQPVKPRPLNAPPNSRSPPHMRPGQLNYGPRPVGPQNDRFSPPRQFDPRDPRARPSYENRGGSVRNRSNSAARAHPGGRQAYPGPFNNGQYRGTPPGARQRANSATHLRSPPKLNPTVLGSSSGNVGSPMSATDLTVRKGVPGQAM